MVGDGSLRGHRVVGSVVVDLAVKVEPAAGGQWAELVGAGGVAWVEGYVGGEAGGGALDGGPVGEAGAVRAEQRVVGRGVVGGEGEALAEGAADGGPVAGVGDAVTVGPDRLRGGRRGGHLGGQPVGAGQGGRAPVAKLARGQLAGQGHGGGHPVRIAEGLVDAVAAALCGWV